MPARIDELTQEQIDAMPAHVEKWVDFGLDCSPAPRETVEDGIRRCYRLAGLDEPERIEWALSPVEGALLVSQIDHEFASPGADPLTRDERKTKAKATWRQYIGGQWWASWIAYMTFFRDVCGLDAPASDTWERLDAYTDANRAGWWWPQEKFCVVTERPVHILGEQVAESGWGSHRLHCEDGPAILWRDGATLHAWHGVRVPSSLIEKGWTPEEILRHPNAEVRRAAIERTGWDEFIAQAKLELLSDPVDDPGNEGNTLALYSVPAGVFEEPVNVLLCTNGTPERDGTRRRFGLTVPANITDPVSAAGWTYGLSAEAYREVMRLRT